MVDQTTQAVNQMVDQVTQAVDQMVDQVTQAVYQMVDQVTQAVDQTHASDARLCARNYNVLLLTVYNVCIMHPLITYRDELQSGASRLASHGKAGMHFL